MAEDRSRFAQAFAALSLPGFRLFAASHSLNSLGAQLIQYAIFWQVFELTGSALLIGLTGVARAVPHIILSMIGGVAADRANRLHLVQAGQAANALTVFLLAALTLGGSVEIWHLYAITMVNGGLTALTQPARTAIIPSLVRREKLVNAIALNATISQTSQIAGPAIAGLAIGVIGLGAVYVLNGLFYAFAIVSIVGLRVPAVLPAVNESPWRSLIDGLAFVRHRSVILSLLALDLGAVLLGSYRALMPIIATDLGVGAGGYGILSAAPGVGSLFGTALILSLGDMRFKGLYTVFGVLGYCLALLMLALTPWFSLALVAAGLLGATNSIQMIPRNSAIIAISPEARRGRVEAFRSMLAGGGPPLGYTLSGGVAAALGPASALVFGAAACALVVLAIVARDRELRDPDLGSSTSEPAKAESG